MNKLINSKTFTVTKTALLTALIFIITFAIRIPIPVAAGGYLNIGDVAIYLSAAVLGGPLGALAAGLGSGLSDLLAGYAIYIIPTILIKGLMGYIVGVSMKKNSFPFFTMGAVISGAIMVAGYAIFEAVFFGYAHSISALPFNFIQWVICDIIAILLYPVIKQLKNKLTVPAANHQSNH